MSRLASDLEDFSTTHWTLIERAGRDTTEVRREALAELLNRYLPALRSHLIRRVRIAPDAADDLLHDFVAHKVLDKGIIAQAEQERGRFRSFLLTTLDHFMIDEARKRRLPMANANDPSTEPTIEIDPIEPFNLAWAREVLAEAVEKMRRRCHEAGRPEIWALFEARVLDPTLNQIEPIPYAQLITRLGLESEAQASNLLITGKRMFQRALRSVVARYARTEAEIDSELMDLKKILSQGRAG